MFANNLETKLITYNAEKDIVKEFTLNKSFKNPPHLAVQEKTTGRFFIYDNNNKILVYSSNPMTRTGRDDRTKPLIDTDLIDEKPYR